jgi:hypothetical protein
MMKCSECNNLFYEEDAKKHVDRHGDDYTFDEVTYVSPCCGEAYDEHIEDDEYDYCEICGTIDGCECDEQVAFSRLDVEQCHQHVVNMLFPEPIQAVLRGVGVDI